MILIATLSDCQRECSRKFKGKWVRSRVYLAADKFNLCIASQTDDSQVIGHKYCHRLDILSKYFNEFDLDEKALHSINHSFKRIFGIQDQQTWSYKKLDKEFELFKRAENGEDLLIYKKLKAVIASCGQVDVDDETSSVNVLDILCRNDKKETESLVPVLENS